MVRQSLFIGLMCWIVCLGCSPSKDANEPEATTVVSEFGEARVGDETDARARDDSVEETLPPAATSDEQAEQELTLGDPAPPLQIASWTKGEAVPRFFEEGKVTVVEFWATWCGPCKTTMPHLSELQKQHADAVHFVGITDEDAETVRRFLDSPHPVETERTWDDVVQYALAIDDEGATNQAYLEAAGQDGIPTAFIVGKSGIVEWIGHPMTIDEPLQQILDGTYDVQAAREEMEQTRQLEQKMQTLGLAFQQAVGKDDKPAALEVLNQMDEVMPDNPSIGIDRFELLFQMERTDDAYESMERVVKQLWDHPDFLEYLTVRIADDLPEPQRRLDVAQRLAERAVELTNRSPGALDALARVHFRQGDLAAAIEVQRQAVEASGQSAGDYQDRLDQYLEEKDAAGSSSEESVDN